MRHRILTADQQQAAGGRVVMQTIVVWIPQAGWYIINRDREKRQWCSRCYKTFEAARRAQRRLPKSQR